MEDIIEETSDQPSAPASHPGNQPDVYVKCPYFPEHELRKSRLPYHLLKCQNNPNAPNLVACPFNYLHRVRPEEQKDHIQLCEDRLVGTYADRDPPSFAKTLKKEHKVDSKRLQPGRQREMATSSNDEWW